MSRRGVTLTLSFFFIFSILPAGAQKSKPAPKTVDNAAQQKEKSKKAETDRGVLKGWADEVAYIITDNERKAFKKLTTDEERESFTENFWLVRDPSPDTPENEFRDQFYERIDYANDHFTSGVAGMRTDRGRMYILNGPPDEIVSHPSGGSYDRPAEEGGGRTNTFPFETWRYRHLDNRSQSENVIYEFVDSTMSGEYRLEYDPGAKDALKHVPGVGLTDAEVALGLDKGDRPNKTNQILDGMSAPIPQNTYGNSEFDILQKYNEAYKVADVRYKDLLVPASTRLSTNPLPYKVQAHYIKLTSDSVRTLITIELLTKDLAFKPENGGQVASAHVTGVVYRSDNRRMSGSSFSQDINVQFASEKALKAALDRPNLYQVTTYLAPGRYKLHLTVEDKNSQSIKIDDVLLSPPRIPDQTLQASSMILAYSVTDMPPKAVGTEMFVLGDKKVKPNVSGVFKPEESLNVWQEIYGLEPDQTTHKPSASIELLITQNKQEIKKVVTDSTELAGSGLQMKYSNSVPLKGFAPGQYEVQVKVTDNISKESFVSSKNFSVAANPVR
jgi:GWxTD domain-containing protein